MRKIVAIVPITMSSLHGLTMRDNLLPWWWLPWWWLPWWWLLNTGHSPLDTGLSGGVVIKPLYMSSVYGGIMAVVCVHVYSEPSPSHCPVVDGLQYAQTEREGTGAFVLVYMLCNEASNTRCCCLCMLYQHVVLANITARIMLLCLRQPGITHLCT